MRGLTRQEVREEFKEIIEECGTPKKGKIFCIEQLIEEIISDVSYFDKTYIMYENGEFKVSPNLPNKKKYGYDFRFLGRVNIEEWFTKEQIVALHESAFGVRFFKNYNRKTLNNKG